MACIRVNLILFFSVKVGDDCVNEATLRPALTEYLERILRGDSFPHCCFQTIQHLHLDSVIRWIVVYPENGMLAQIELRGCRDHRFEFWQLMDLLPDEFGHLPRTITKFFQTLLDSGL